MGKRAWFRAYVERLLMEQFDTTSLIKDGDGDVPFSKGTSACGQVCSIADDIGSLFAGVHGGSTPFPVDAQAG